MPPKVQLQGRRFGRWEVLGEEGRTDAGAVKWLCRCDCGNSKAVKGQALTSGASQSCGCLNLEVRAEICRSRSTHRRTNDRIYNIWVNIKARCLNPKNPKFPRYGGRGIRLCDRWQAFESFLADVGEPPAGDYSLDRIDVDGHYEPGNIRWATMRQQQNNRGNNRLIAAFGATRTLQEWANERGIDHKTIDGRLRRGWVVERAITEPPVVGRNQFSG